MRTLRPPPCLAVPFLALMLVTTSLAAQRDRTVVGGQAGYARSWISTTSDSVNDNSARQGAYVGLFVRTRLFKGVALQPEVDLTVKGGTVPLAGAPEGSRNTLEFGYLELPLLVRFAPSLSGRGRGFRPVAFAGASAGFHLGCTVSTVSVTDSLSQSSCDQDLKSVEWSWLVGGGVQWNTKGVSLGLEARYMKAFNSVIDSPLNPKNNLFAILIVLTI